MHKAIKIKVPSEGKLLEIRCLILIETIKIDSVMALSDDRNRFFMNYWI